MPIPIAGLEFDNSDAIDIHCPACGAAVITKDDSEPIPCAHVEFISFAAGDIEYVREDLEPQVSAWREKAEEEDQEFDLAEALCERRNSPASFAFLITWEGMPETLEIGFSLRVEAR